MSLEDADEEQSQLINELKDVGKGKISVEERSFLKNAALFLSARKEVVNNFKCKTFPIKNQDKIPILSLPPKPSVFYTSKTTKKELGKPHLNCIKIFKIKL